MFAGDRYGGSVPWYVLVVPNVASNAVVCSAGDARHCMGFLSLDSSDAGCGADGFSSDESGICLFSEGRLSPLNLCMLGRAIPR